jgi:hypothetical protein
MVPHRSIKWIVTACLALTSCGNFSAELLTPADPTPETPVPALLTPGETGAPQPIGSPTPAPDFVHEIRDAQYQLGLPDSLQIVQLADGKFEQGTAGSADFISVFVTDFIARGDLNGDNQNEVAALVSENYGGTGTFIFLVVYSEVDGNLVFQTSKLVDDRPQINMLLIEDKEIFLDAITHGFEDPMCCPTLKTTRHFRFIDGQLDMIDYTTYTPDGRPRTITITSPASGTATYSSVQIKGEVAIAPFENNLVYRIYDVGNVELSAGAISVVATDLGAPGTFDTVIPIGTALSGAVIRIEVQDVSAADGSLFAMDSVELVVQ